jgi:hypothetical protein
VSRVLPTIVETNAFTRKAAKLLTADEHDDLIVYLSNYYAAGDEIQGTGGVRKLRYAVGGRGKSGGVRVIYYFFDENNPILALLLYAKNEQSNLTTQEKKFVTSIAAALKAEAKVKRSKR